MPGCLSLSQSLRVSVSLSPGDVSLLGTRKVQLCELQLTEPARSLGRPGTAATWRTSPSELRSGFLVSQTVASYGTATGVRFGMRNTGRLCALGHRLP